MACSPTLGSCSRLAALAALLAVGFGAGPAAAGSQTAGCPAGITLQVLQPDQASATAPGRDPDALSSALPQAPEPSAFADYRHRLSSTPLGWPTRPHWCVWVEPALEDGPAARWEQAWLQAVEAALATWADLVPITRVASPDQAQVRILRRRPPLRGGRASHGRAELALALVQRGQQQVELEPQVQVSLSPGQRQEALQATALHELGHAFGLWGHSDDRRDAMAAVPGPVPVLQLSPRDRATFQWLQRQPGLSPAAPRPPAP